MKWDGREFERVTIYSKMLGECGLDMKGEERERDVGDEECKRDRQKCVNKNKVILNE